LLTPFLACDEDYKLPDDSELREKFEEFINYIRKYEFIY